MVSPKPVKPWHVRGWVGCRLKELVWQGVSWPYLWGIAMTLLFLWRQTEITLGAMSVAWMTALGNRALKAWQAYKNGEKR